MCADECIQFEWEVDERDAIRLADNFHGMVHTWYETFPGMTVELEFSTRQLRSASLTSKREANTMKRQALVLFCRSLLPGSINAAFFGNHSRKSAPLDYMSILVAVTDACNKQSIVDWCTKTTKNIWVYKPCTLTHSLTKGRVVRYDYRLGTLCSRIWATFAPFNNQTPLTSRPCESKSLIWY